MDPTIGVADRAAPTVDPNERAAALANARRAASEDALRTAEAADSRRAEARAETRAILERAVGANTRLSISRPDNAGTFIYRAIDRDTGEVLQEWPPVQFARFLEQSGAGASAIQNALAGGVIDQEA